MNYADKLAALEYETDVRIPAELELAFNAAIDSEDEDAIKWRYEQIEAHVEAQCKGKRTSSELVSITPKSESVASAESVTAIGTPSLGTLISTALAQVDTSKQSVSPPAGAPATPKRKRVTNSKSPASKSGKQQGLWSES